MIALINQLPMVRWHEQLSVPLSVGWLEESIDHAAQQSECRYWQWSQDVASALLAFLREDFHDGVISREQIEQLMRRSLVGIGYPEVAKKACLLPPRISIHLPEIARQAPYELIFYPLLRQRLQFAVNMMVRGVRLKGIRSCAKTLGQARRWTRECQDTSDQIVAFARQELYQLQRASVELLIC